MANIFSRSPFSHDISNCSFFRIAIQSLWQIRALIIPAVSSLLSSTPYTGSTWLTEHPVLLEAPFNPQRRRKNSVLLAIDLTKAVADEAIDRGDSVVVAYRMLFRPFYACFEQKEGISS